MRSRFGPAAVRGESQRCRVARSWTRDASRMMRPGPVRVVRPVRPGPLWRNPGHALLGAPPLAFAGKEKERKTGEPPRPSKATGADDAWPFRSAVVPAQAGTHKHRTIER